MWILDYSTLGRDDLEMQGKVVAYALHIDAM